MLMDHQAVDLLLRRNATQCTSGQILCGFLNQSSSDLSRFKFSLYPLDKLGLGGTALHIFL